jgi:hypothetical protein
METTVISVHNRNYVGGAYSKWDVDELGNRKVVKGEKKVLKKGWVQYVEIITLPNGKKESVTRHGPRPE